MKPDKSTLETLYLVDKLSTRTIGEMYGVAHITVRRWLTAYGIPIRPTGRGLINRGILEPTRDELYDMVHVQYLTYENIAAVYGVDQSAIQHWLIKHDIPRPAGRIITRGLPSREQLISLYESGESIIGIGRMFGVSDGPIRRLLHDYGIPIRKDGWDSGKRITCLDGHRVRSTYEQRVDDWLFQHGVHHVYEPALPCDRRYHADFWANGWYIEIWGVKNHPVYKNRRQRKLALYKAHNMPLIEITAGHFDTAHKGKWMRILKSCISATAYSQDSLAFA